MLRDVQNDPEHMVKDKGRSIVQESIRTYDNVAGEGYSSREIADQSNPSANTKKASDLYTRQQDRTTHSRSVTRWNNTNLRGGGGGGK